MLILGITFEGKLRTWCSRLFFDSILSDWKVCTHTPHMFVYIKHWHKSLFMLKCCWSWTGVVTASPTSQRAHAEQMVWNRTGSLLALQNSWQQRFLFFLKYTTAFRRPSLSFLGVFIGVTQSKWFWLVYPKGELSSLAVDKGISLRKGEEEEEEGESVVWCWQNETLLS